MADLQILRMYTIYQNPADLEPGYAVRERLVGHQGAKLGPVLAQGLADLEDARRAVPPQADACIFRDPDDDPTIVETWM